MRKLYLFNMMTVDGFIEGPSKGEIDWHNVDAEFNEFSFEQLNATDLLYSDASRMKVWQGTGPHLLQ